MTEKNNNPYRPAHIANYILWKVWKANIEITQMKLIKLVYIAYGWNLVINDDQTLFEEDILAWEHGPVIPSIYDEFKVFGSRPITKGNYAGDFNTETGELLSVPIVSENDSDILKVLNAAWDNYKHTSLTMLHRITNEPKSPWCIAYDNGKGKNTKLDNKLIKASSLEVINGLVRKYLNQLRT